MLIKDIIENDYILSANTYKIPTAGKKGLEQAMSGHILDQGMLIGLYERMK